MSDWFAGLSIDAKMAVVLWTAVIVAELAIYVSKRRRRGGSA